MSTGYLNLNWEANVIEINPKMRHDRTVVISALNYWFRQHSENNNHCNILPECVEIICTEFYVIAQCGDCGHQHNELFLNLYDGYIGCSRFVNKCSLDHWNKCYNDTDIKRSSLVVSLNSICENGANIWCYVTNQWYSYDGRWKWKTTNRDKMVPLVCTVDTDTLDIMLIKFGIKMKEYKWEKQVQQSHNDHDKRKIIIKIKKPER
eukprot:325223_1